MVDTQFEQILRAHSFWQEWQNAADRSGDVDTYLDSLIAKASPQWKGVDADEFMDMVRGREPETITEHLASVSEDWAVVLERFKRLIKEHKGTEEPPFKKHHPRTDVMTNPCLWNPSKEPAPFKVLSIDSVPFDANRINDPDFDPFGFNSKEETV